MSSGMQFEPTSYSRMLFRALLQGEVFASPSQLHHPLLKLTQEDRGDRGSTYTCTMLHSQLRSVSCPSLEAVIYEEDLISMASECLA